MITEIGIVAGEILTLLEEKKIPVSILDIKFSLDEPMELIDMAIGWLIRENYVQVLRGGQKYLVLSQKSLSSSVLDGIRNKQELYLAN